MAALTMEVTPEVSTSALPPSVNGRDSEQLLWKRYTKGQSTKNQMDI
jgi:hypothetical protein